MAPDDAGLPSATSDEQVVVTGATAGRDAEFTAFMTEAEPLLARMAWLLCGDVHRAEELVQQTLVKTYVAWPRARDGDPLAYARRTLSNLRIDTWRKHRPETLLPPEEMPGGHAPSTAHHHAERDALVRALARVSPQRRRVVVLRYLMDVSESDVARDLNISVGTVKSTAHRGLEQLRGLLTDPLPIPRAAAHPDSEDVR